jgi:trehalose synthase
MSNQDYLVQDVESCAKQALKLLDGPEERRAFGKAGQEKVRREFLLPRLIRDELKLIKEVLSF